MSAEINSKIDGEFTGFNGGMIFKLTNGQVWQQKRYRYKYRYAYRPSVRIYRDGHANMMAVAGMDEPMKWSG